MAKKECPRCKGKGTVECKFCLGTGGGGPFGTSGDCPHCKGKGEYSCPNCNGTGEVEDRH
jgi:DnaJ-class molecular chaperone